MNMMSVLLGATGLLLVAAFALSFSSLGNGMGKDTTQEQIAGLRAEIEALKLQEANLLSLRHGGMTAPASNYTPPVDPTPSEDELAVMAAEIEALKEQNEALEGQVEDSEKKADVYRDEAGLVGQKMIESHDGDQRRARLVREALLIATVNEWAESEGFAVLSIQRPDAVQEGTILGIRRNKRRLGTSSCFPNLRRRTSHCRPPYFPPME